MESSYYEVENIDEIRIYYIESGNSRGMLSVYHSKSDEVSKKYETLSVIRTFGSDYLLHEKNIKSETPEMTLNRLKKIYNECRLTSVNAYLEFDGALGYPQDEETIEYHEWLSDKSAYTDYTQKVLDKLILCDYERCELLTVRKKSNDWKHEL